MPTRLCTVYRVEFHCHSKEDPQDNLNYSCEEAIDKAAEIGVKVLAITWHRTIFNRPELIRYAGDRGVLLIPGVEAEMGRSHILILNVQPGDVTPGDITWDEIRKLRARRSDVLVIAPHPFYILPFCLGKKLDDGVDCVDALEWCFAHVGFLPLFLTPNGWAKNWAAKHGKPLIACSDAHSLTMIGQNGSYLDAKELTIESLFQAVRENRIQFDRKGLSVVKLMKLVIKVFFDIPYHAETFFRKGKRRQVGSH